jgi:MFS family permease
MRRVSGFVLTLLGAFLLVVAVLLRFWVAPSVIEFPLNEYQIVQLAGTGSYFSPAKEKDLVGVSVLVTQTTKGAASAGTGAAAVWDGFVAVQDTTNRAAIAYAAFREALNRRTGELVSCCGEYITNPVTGKPDSSVRMTGIGPVWPFGAQQRTYLIFDTIAGRPEPARYAGIARISGILTYRYLERVAPTRFGTEPNSLTGPLGEYYSATNTYFVDPETGIPLKITENQEVTLADASGATTLVSRDLSVAETASSVQSAISTDNTYRGEIALDESTLPLIGLTLGLLFLAGGILLVQFGGEAPASEFAWVWRRELNHYPSTGRRFLYLAITVLATITLYYELYVGGSVSTLLLVNVHISFTFFVVILAIGNLIGAFGSLFAGLADRLGRANLLVFGLLISGILVAYVLPTATNKWSFSIEFFVVNVVEGITLVATPALIRDYSPQVGRATAMGFWTAGPVLGSLIVTAVATNTIPAFVPDPRFWTHEYRICGIVGLVVFLITLAGLRELSPRLRDQLMVTMHDRALIEARAKGLDVDSMLQHPFRQLLKPDIVVAAIGVSTLLLVYYTSVGFGLIYLSTVFGFSTKNANGLLNWNWGFNVVAVILIGMIADLVRVRKPFMVIGGIGTAVMTVVYLEQAGHHPGYYTLAVILALLSLFLGIAYPPWLASFTETVEARNPALIATGLAIWGWIIRVLIFAAFLVIPFVITSVTPLVNYGSTVQAYATTYKSEIAFARSHPAVVATVAKYKTQVINAQTFAPELAVIQAHPALFAKLIAYPSPAAIPPALINQAIAAAGGGAKGLGVLTTIDSNRAAIEGVISVAPVLETLKPYSAQLTALSKVPPQVFPYLEAHGAAVQKAAADAPGQWKDWYWVCFAGAVFFLLCIPLLRGRWSPAAARRDEEEHEAATQAELAKLEAAPSPSAPLT